jgi:hypothetical protein
VSISTRALADRAARAGRWHRELVAEIEGASVEEVALA